MRVEHASSMAFRYVELVCSLPPGHDTSHYDESFSLWFGFPPE
jgi:hypothetical protein